MKRNEVPKQGLLNDVRVVVSAISVAGPFAGEILADMGADVIQLENPQIRTFLMAAQQLQVGRGNLTAEICGISRWM